MPAKCCIASTCKTAIPSPSRFLLTPQNDATMKNPLTRNSTVKLLAQLAIYPSTPVQILPMQSPNSHNISPIRPRNTSKPLNMFSATGAPDYGISSFATSDPSLPLAFSDLFHAADSDNRKPHPPSINPPVEKSSPFAVQCNDSSGGQRNSKQTTTSTLDDGRSTTPNEPQTPPVPPVHSPRPPRIELRLPMNSKLLLPPFLILKIRPGLRPTTVLDPQTPPKQTPLSLLAPFLVPELDIVPAR